MRFIRGRIFWVVVIALGLGGCGQSENLPISSKPPSTLPKFLIHQNNLGEAGDLEIQKPFSCLDPDVRSIDVPVFSGHRWGPSYKYNFRWVKALKPSVGTVIYIPGGPGYTSMNVHPSHMPANLDVIYTDPRGAGCNTYDPLILPDKAIRTDYIAADIVNVIQELRLKNYIIFGQSYGTVVSTLLTHQIEALGITRPQLVVLEGTLGRAFKSIKESNAEYESQLNQANIPSDIMNEFLLSQSPFGISMERWFNWFQHWALLGPLLYGDGQSGSYYINVFEVAVSKVKTPEVLEKISRDMDRIFAASQENKPFSKSRTYLPIFCNELLLGRKDQIDRDSCGDRKPKRPYNSAKFSLTTPLYYFHGQLDPATPLVGARYHFLNNPQAVRVFVGVTQAGHVPLSNQLRPCQQEIWNGLFSEKPSENLFQSLKACALPLNISVDLHLPSQVRL